MKLPCPVKSTVLGIALLGLNADVSLANSVADSKICWTPKNTTVTYRPIITETNGRLVPADQHMADGSPYDEWQFTIDSPMSVIINLTSEDVDGYLFLLDDQGDVLKEADDNLRGRTPNLNAQLRARLPEAGTYTVITNSYIQDSRRDLSTYGDYRFSVHQCVYQPKRPRRLGS